MHSPRLRRGGSGVVFVESGTVLAGRYRLDEMLGRGGMGEVWRCRDLRLGRDVAVKVLLATDPDQEDVRRFRREAEAAAALRHPGITVVFDIDEADGRMFIVTELLHGQNLADLLKEHPGGLPAGRALDLGIEIASALEHAHGHGIVHRDLKPLNLFVQAEGPLKVCDFGIARDLNATSSLTTHGIGTPGYMSPEQWEAKPASPGMDLYSLGCVLYQSLTGRLPFGGPTIPAFMRQHFQDVPAPPRDLRPDVPAELSDLVLRLLAKDPADRPASAGVVLDELRRIRQSLGGGTDAHDSRDDRSQDADGTSTGGPRTHTITQTASAPRDVDIEHLASFKADADVRSMYSPVFSPDGRLLAATYGLNGGDGGDGGDGVLCRWPHLRGSIPWSTCPLGYRHPAAQHTEYRHASGRVRLFARRPHARDRRQRG